MTTVTALHRPTPLPPIKHEKIQGRAQVIVVGVLIGLIVSGLYAGTTQVHWYVPHIWGLYWQGWDLKYGWDVTTGNWLAQHTWFITSGPKGNWLYYRHNVRDIGIPSLAIFGVMSIFTPANYSGKQYRGWRLALSLVLFFLAFAVLVTVGTWIGLLAINRPGHTGAFFAAHDFLLWVGLGIIISQVLHHLFGPVGASLQSKWVELSVDNYWRGGGGTYPKWVRTNWLTPVTARRLFDTIALKDWATGEGERLIAEGPNALSKAIWILAGLVLPVALWLAALGFIFHFLVGTFGMSIPYLAP
jgi:hypothetical protein